MALFDSNFLTKCQYLTLATNKLRGGRLFQQQRAKHIAGGTEVTGHRDYSPGEDFGNIDWHLAARHDELLVKQYYGDEDLHIYILLDCSQSMRLGSPSKFDLARQLAGALSYIALANLCRLGVVAFAHQIVSDYPIIRGKTNILPILKFLEGQTLREGETNLTETSSTLAQRMQRHGTVIVLSDLYDPAGFRSGIDILRRRGYEPYLIQVHDPCEADPGVLGDVQFVDVESGQRQTAVLTERAAAKYLSVYHDFQDSVRRYCYDYGFGHWLASTEKTYDQTIIQMMQSGALMR